MSQNNYPRLVAAPYIYNSKGEIFLFSSPKWKGMLVPPGGHVEFGEKWKTAVIREIKEETNLNIKDVQEIKLVEFISSDDYTKHKHIVSINCIAYLDGEDQEVILDNREGTSFEWLKPEDAVKDERVEKTTRNTIKEYLIKEKKKKSIFNKKCKNCEKNEIECAEYKAGWQRALADYKNLQTEITNKKSEWIKISEVQILEEFIPVYEHLQMSIDNEEVQKDNNPWVQGVRYVLKQFKDILDNHGIQEIKAIGEEFDPNFHEVVKEEKSDKPSGEILKQTSVGYKMGEKVLRAAKVIISK